MISNKKIEKLKKYISHPRYGKLIEDAINIWKIYDPIKDHWGVILSKDGISYTKDDSNDCSLFGSLLINKECILDLGPFAIIGNFYNISSSEVCAMEDGFNHPLSLSSYIDIKTQEALLFGKEISKIIF